MWFKRFLSLSATFLVLSLTVNVSGLLGQGDDFVGIVRSNNGSVVVIEAWNEATQTPFNINILIGTETKIYGDQERTQEIPVSDIPDDYVVHVIGEKQANGDILAAEIIVDGPAPPPPGPQPGDKYKFGGEITRIGSGYLEVSWHNPDTGESGTDRIYFDASTSIIDESGNPTTLAVGDFIDGEIEIQSDGSVKALTIKKFYSGPQPGETFKFGGEVIEVGPNYIKVRWENPTSGESGVDEVKLDASTRITDEDGNPTTIAVGNFVDGEREVQSDGSELAISIIVYLPGPQPGDIIKFVAKILSIGSDSIEVEVRDPDGKVHLEKVQKDVSIPVTDKNGNPATIDILAAGDFIEGEVKILEGDEADVLWVRVLSQEPPLPGEEEAPFAGRVVSVGSDYIEIEVPGTDGSPETLRLSVDNVTELKDQTGSVIRLSDFVVGEEVLGTFDPIPEDGQLFADLIQKGTKPGPAEEPVRFAGKIVNVGTDYIEIEVKTPEGATVTGRAIVDAKTRLLDSDGKTELTLADFAVGDEIFGEGIPTGNEYEVTAILIQKGAGPEPVFFAGIILEIGADYIDLEVPSPDGTTVQRLRVILDEGTELFSEDGTTEIALATLTVGDNVNGQGEPTGNNLELLAFHIQQGTPGPMPGEMIDFSGKLLDFGSDYIQFEHGYDQETGKAESESFAIDQNTAITDENGNTAALETGYLIEGQGEVQTDGTVKAVSIRIHFTSANLPGEKVFIGGSVVKTGSDFIIIQHESPDGPILELKVFVISDYNVTDSEGNPVSAESFTVGDFISGEGMLQPCGVIIALLVSKETGPGPGEEPVEFFGKVITLTNEGFELETRDAQNRPIVLRVILSDTTSIVREGTEEALSRDQILKGMGIMVEGMLTEENRLEAILVGVPQPERESFGGRVVSIEQNKFVVEVKPPEQNLTFKVVVTTSEATAWFVEEDDTLEPASAEDLNPGAFVSVCGVLSGPLAVAADTVWIESVEEYQITTFTILEGKVVGSVFTLKFNVFESDPSQQAVLAEVTLNISPDFRSLKGQIVYPDDPENPDAISLNKITGELGKLTGRWTGGVDEDGELVPLAGDFVQSGSSVTGTVTAGGTIESDTEEGLQVGDEITVRGEVIELSENSFILSFRDRLNQELQRPVLFFASTGLVDSEGNELDIPFDSLLRRKVEVTGIIQSDFSLVAKWIVLESADTELEPSAELPLIASGTWNPADGTLAFDLEADAFDDELDGLVTMSGQLGGEGNNLYAAGMLTAADSLKISLRRQSGEPDDPSGTWTGTAESLVNDHVKIWPVFLNLLVKDGVLSGNYGIGEGRIKGEIVAQNLPPVIDPFAEITAAEEQQINVTVTATDPESDQITLSVPGYQIPGSSFTDNGDGTGTYTLTIPRLPEGKTELIINFAAQDSKGAETSRVLVIRVTRLNRAPELKVVTDTLRLFEGRAFSVVIPARDMDNDPLTFEFAGLPEWATTDNNQVTFDPPFGAAGNYSFTLTVRDGKGGETSLAYNFSVLSANRPPRFLKIEPIESETGALISFDLKALDPDPKDILTFSVLEVAGVEALPQGASFDAATGKFNWTPTAEQVGPFKAAFVVTDSKGAKDYMSVNIVVGSEAVIGAGAFPPSLDVPDSLAVNQGEKLEFTATGATNTDQLLKFYARQLPRRAEFDIEGHIFSWTPDFKQEGNYTVIVGVGDGSFRTEQDVIITVNKVVQTPTLDPLEDQTVSEGNLLRFRVLGYYPDGMQVMFDQPAGLPDNSLFDVVTGNFRFLPGYDQAGTYNLTFSVTEDGGTTYSVSVTVTVTDNNRPPKLVELKNVSVNLGQSVSFDVKAYDPDPADVLTVEAVEIPQGATFNATATPPAFSWTPSEEGSYQATFKVTDAAGANSLRTVYITVGMQNLPPALGEIADLTVSEGDTLNLAVSVSDPENDPVTVFANPIPANATFITENNTFSFQPSYAQAGTYNVKFFASDGELTDEKPVTIQVIDVPLPPVISVSRAWSVQEGDTLEFTVNVRDAAGERVEVISSTLPDGASLVPASGKFFWAPDFDQAGTYSITFIASDGTQTARQDIVIAVEDRNRPPWIFEIEDQEVTEGEIISFEITTTDPDGDHVTIAIDSTETPYIESADIRNNSVFVFNTTLLDENLQIPSAVFIITADDGRGGADRRAIAFKILRSSEVNVPTVNPGAAPFNYNFPGTGFTVNMTNQGSTPVSGNLTGSELSGALDTTQQSGPLLAARYPHLARSKDKVVVMPFLAGDDGNSGDFYSIRRGWGLDLSSDLLNTLEGLKFDLTFQYEDRDIPARDIPEFTESAISIFGLNLQGEFIQLATLLDTEANTATAEADLALYTDFTLGVILDLAEPVIAGTSQLVNTTDELGPYTVSTTIVDNVLVRSAKLYYAIEGQAFQAVEMTPDTVMINGFNGSIPGQREGNTILYYVEAGDSLHTVTDPVGAPQSAYSFSILLDGVESVRPGDVDNNGQVNIFDLLGLLKVLSGTQQATGGADTNQDSQVNIFDLLELLKILAQ